VSSNLERLLALLCGDSATVAQWMQQLSTQGYYQIPRQLLEKIQKQFWAGCCTDEEGADAIARVWSRYGYLCDTHTASGWAVAEDYVNQTRDRRPMVVLSTASPYKFPAAVLSAIGEQAAGDEFAQMEQLHGATGVKIPKNLSNLRQKPELHQTVIEKDAMCTFVLSLKKEN